MDSSLFLSAVLSDPSTPPRLLPFFETFQSLYDARLWFQLTNALEAFLAVPESGPYQIRLFNNFVNSFKAKLNQLKLVTIGITVARQFNGQSSTTPAPPSSAPLSPTLPPQTAPRASRS